MIAVAKLVIITIIGGIVAPAASRFADSHAEPVDVWHLVRTPNPTGGAEAISIMHTADTSASDPDFAGVMIRCTERRLEIGTILIRSFSFHTKPEVTIGDVNGGEKFVGVVSPPGTVVLLPKQTTDQVLTSWQTATRISITVNDGQREIRGVVNTDNLDAALNSLKSNCQAN